MWCAKMSSIVKISNFMEAKMCWFCQENNYMEHALGMQRQQSFFLDFIVSSDKWASKWYTQSNFHSETSFQTNS